MPPFSLSFCAPVRARHGRPSLLLRLPAHPLWRGPPARAGWHAAHRAPARLPHSNRPSPSNLLFARAGWPAVSLTPRSLPYLRPLRPDLFLPVCLWRANLFRKSSSRPRRSLCPLQNLPSRPWAQCLLRLCQKNRRRNLKRLPGPRRCPRPLSVLLARLLYAIQPHPRPSCSRAGVVSSAWDCFRSGWATRSVP